MNNKIINELKTRFKPIGIVVVILVVIGALFYSFYLYRNPDFSKNIVDLYSLLADMVTVVTLLFLVIQIVWFCKDFNKKHARKSKENALDMSRFYVESILPNQAFLCAVLFESNIAPELKKIRRHSLVSFDQGEYHDILDEEEIKKISNILDNIDVSIINKYEHILDEKYTRPYRTPDYTRKLMTRVLDDTLNYLEYMSMAFNQKIADEKVVYQSLHQTFLKCVEVLYFRIVWRNFSATDKYYTNVITLYHSWKKRAIEKRILENSAVENNIEHGVPLI